MMFQFFIKSELEQISDLVEKDLNSFFLNYGFSFSDKKNFSRIASKILFTRGSNYLAVFIEDLKTSGFMQGIPGNPYKNWGILIRIGDGGFEFPELLWSSIKLGNPLSLDDYKDFQFDNKKEVLSILEVIKNKLIDSEIEFLKGDLSKFFSLRLEMVNLKEPGEIVFENTKSGKKTTKVNEENLFYKQKYSKL